MEAGIKGRRVSQIHFSNVTSKDSRIDNDFLVTAIPVFSRLRDIFRHFHRQACYHHLFLKFLI